MKLIEEEKTTGCDTGTAPSSTTNVVDGDCSSATPCISQYPPLVIKYHHSLDVICGWFLSELRILLNLKSSTLKAVLLNPASQFTELVSKCRSIIVAGGTMQPFSEFQDQLFVQAGIYQKILSKK